MELGQHINMQQRYQLKRNRDYISALEAFIRYRPEVDILPTKG